MKIKVGRKEKHSTSTLGATDYNLWAKSSRLPVFINKVLLEHSSAHLFTYCQWLLFALGRQS